MNVVGEKKHGGATVLQLSGRMEAKSAPGFESTLDHLIGEGEIHLVFGFSQVDYISSAGLRTILGPAKKILAAGGKIALADLQPNVKKAFEMLGAGAVLPLFDTMEAAVAALQ